MPARTSRANGHDSGCVAGAIVSGIDVSGTEAVGATVGSIVDGVIIDVVVVDPVVVSTLDSCVVIGTPSSEIAVGPVSRPHPVRTTRAIDKQP
jgi:hypothetical protein